MRKNLRRCFTVVLLSSLILLPTTAMAEMNVVSISSQEETGVAPCMTYIVESVCDLSISGTTATVDCWVEGQYGDATKAKVIAELQVKSGNNWIAYGTWVDTQNDYEAAVYETKEVKKGNTYRVKATYTVWEGSASESLILFSDEITA